ncbi:MAG: hypothetical protein CL677_06275 [Bdellovibrionaceae bacterium]|nr:hypothetical protein [Pseudobdellovibrionaceae bacterium]|tara:strand:+ start:24512 stop:24781 length:270 start_codon:yes stop_codon:yes gene_type:complete
MKVEIQDQLFCLFKESLEISGVLYETEEEFVSFVVERYIESTNLLDRVPLAFIDDFKEDLANDVYDMLLKTTYGHFSLKEYRKSKSKST